MIIKKRGLTTTVSCPVIAMPGCQPSFTKTLEQTKTPVEPRWAKKTYKKLKSESTKVNSIYSGPSEYINTK